MNSLDTTLEAIAAQSPESPILALLLAEQRQTAVERFSTWHESEADGRSEVQRRYRDLVPLSAPRPGEQFAFEVDLDACSGCKACVTACHNLNGLEPGETWRSVGLLAGGSNELPIVQHVTTACHHCLEPACLEGCPVNAYEKDDVTGIVRHLDDQCIGCQYCIFKCPYDVPKYSRSKGIVRKCDMCQQRLAVGEAPACVQACPNQAIRITVVEKQAVVDGCETNLFLPGAPEPGYTLPTTIYRSARAWPRNMLPADYYLPAPQPAHWPLIVMLVLTQMSVGAFCVEQVLARQQSWLGWDGVRAVHLIAATLLGLLGLTASVFHLGRPWLAFRAVIGLRTSWLSREIVVFGLFAAAAVSYAGLAALGHTELDWLGLVAALAGVAGVGCSVMIYADTCRPYWSGPATAAKFFGTSVLLGVPTALLISLAAAMWSSDLTVEQVMTRYGYRLFSLLFAVAGLKLLIEAAVFRHLQDKRLTLLKRTALLLTGPLGLTTIQRFFFGLVGGLLLPGFVLLNRELGGTAFRSTFVAMAIGLCFVVNVLGELCERYLFFRAVVAPKMPGTPQ